MDISNNFKMRISLICAIMALILGYSFINAQGENQEPLITNPSEEQANQTITFNVDGGLNTPANIVQAVDSNVNLDDVAPPTKAGYAFSGWFANENKYSGTILMPVDGLNLVAKWDALDQTITFDVRGGSSKPDNIIQKTATQVDISNIVPTKKGYQLKGWYHNDVKYNNIFSMPPENITLTAMWIPVLSADGDNEKFKGSNIIISASNVKNLNLAYVKMNAKPLIYLTDENNVKVQDIAIKSIDKTKVQAKQGSYPLYIISESNQRHLIYVSVGKTKAPKTNNVNALDSSSFKMTYKEYTKFVKNKTIEKEVIKRSSTKAWNIKTNKTTGKISVIITKPKNTNKVKITIKVSGVGISSLQDINVSSDELSDDIIMDITGTDDDLPRSGYNNLFVILSMLSSVLLIGVRLRKEIL